MMRDTSTTKPPDRRIDWPMRKYLPDHVILSLSKDLDAYPRGDALRSLAQRTDNAPPQSVEAQPTASRSLDKLGMTSVGWWATAPCVAPKSEHLVPGARTSGPLYQSGRSLARQNLTDHVILSLSKDLDSYGLGGSQRRLAIPPTNALRADATPESA